MVLKNQARDVTPFNILPPRVSRNETYMRDAFSSRLESYQKAAKKKQEVPRHPGGIWDIDDLMEVTESFQTQRNDREHFRQQLSMFPRFEDYSSENRIGVAMESEDVMDTKECYGSECSPLVVSAFQKEELISKELSGRVKEALEDIKMHLSSKNQSDKLKKKNSEEFSDKISKRCRTSSITEVNPPLCASVDDIKTEINMTSKSVKELSPFTPEPRVTVFPKQLSVQQEQRNLISNHIGSDAEVEVVKSSEKIKVTLYQKEIDVMRRVISIFESFDLLNPPGKASYSVEIKDLQRICNILKHLESSNSQLLTDMNPHVSQKDDKVPKTCNEGNNMAAGGAVSFLNGVQCDESKSDEPSRRDACNCLGDNPHSLKFYDLPDNNKDNILLNEDHISNKTIPVWRQQCSDFTADDGKKSAHLSKSKQVGNSKFSGDYEKDQANSLMEKIMNGTLPFKPSGSPPPAIAFSGAAEQTTASGMLKVPTSPPGAMDATSQSASKDATKMLQPTKGNNASSPLKDIDVVLVLTDRSSPCKTKDPNVVMEQIMNGTLPLKPSGSPPPVAAFSGASVQMWNDRKQSGSAPTSPSRVVNSALQLKAMETTENIDAMDTTQAENTTPLSPGCSPPSAVAFSGSAVERAKDSKLSGMIPISTSLSSGTGAATSRPASSISPSKPLAAVSQVTQQTAANFMNTALPLATKNGTPSPKAMNAESQYKVYENKSLRDATFPMTNSGASTLLPSMSSASPTKYIPPPKRNCNEIQVGKEKAPRPILPWRTDGGSPRRYNAQSQVSSQTNTASSTRFNNGNVSPYARDSRNASQWQNWRIKDESPLSKNAAKNLEVDRINPNELSVRRPQQEDKVLNAGQKMDKPASGSKPSEDSNTMISLKIFNEDNSQVEELMVQSVDLVRLKRKFPNLFEVVPSADEQDKVLELNAEAVKMFLRCIFSVSYKLPGWEIALEAYALGKKFQIEKLQEDCRKLFDTKPIYPSQVHYIVLLARKFQITEVLKTSMMFADVQASNIPDASVKATTKKPHCSISCTTSVEPSEFHISLCYMKEKGLGSTKQSDVRCEIFFEALSGSFCITGFQIKLAVESKDLGVMKTIYCDVFRGQSRIFGEEREKPLNSMMIINFKQKLLVGPKEGVTISVLIEDLCLRLCNCILKEKESGKCSTGCFEATFTSDKKNEAKQSLFFVEKLFYTYEGQKK